MCNNAKVTEAFHPLDISEANSEIHSLDAGFLQ